DGARRAESTTWLVSPTGRGKVFPSQHRDLFKEIEASEDSRMIWPFPDGVAKSSETPRIRNGVLVALAECLIVIQAKRSSGSRNAVAWGRRLRRRVFVVPGMPWAHEFMGSAEEALSGTEVLWSAEWLFDALGLPPPDMTDRGAIYEGDLMPSYPIRRRRS